MFWVGALASCLLFDAYERWLGTFPGMFAAADAPSDGRRQKLDAFIPLDRKADPRRI
jgi:hypothetical protein